MKRILAGLLPFMAISNPEPMEELREAYANRRSLYSRGPRRLSRNLPHTPKQKKARRRSMAAKKARRHHRRVA